MNWKKIPAAFVIILSVSCHVFLGPDYGDSPKEIFDRIWNDFNNHYALFDIKGVDWDGIYEHYLPEIQPDMNSYRLYSVCSQMLAELNDAHVSIRTPFSNTTNNDRFNQQFIKAKLMNGGAFDGGNVFMYGLFEDKPNVGYIFIESFLVGKVDMTSGPVQSWAKKIDGILKQMENTDAIILDIRGNRGGLGSNMEYIAGRFISEESDYIKVYTKNGPGRNDFSAPQTWTIKPSGKRYAKPVVLLSDSETTSAAERFILALRTQAHVTHSGETTRGALSLKIVRPLVNGWEYTMSVQKVTNIEGNCYEGTGIIPNLPLTGSPERKIEHILSLF